MSRAGANAGNADDSILSDMRKTMDEAAMGRAGHVSLTLPCPSITTVANDAAGERRPGALDAKTVPGLSDVRDTRVRRRGRTGAKGDQDFELGLSGETRAS